MDANRTLTTYFCLFHRPDRAESALDALEKAGIRRNTVTSTWDQAAGEHQAADVDQLRRLGVPERDVRHLVDGLAEGGVLLSLEAPDSQSDSIERIFHHFSADKIDETDLELSDADRTAPAALAAPVALASSGLPARETEEAVAIPVVAEELLVGKRAVERGGVRVLRRVVAEPVTENLTLHEERAVLERRAVDRPVTPEDLQLGEGTLELVETAEVPVVAKVARVVEEVHVGVVGVDRTEQVTDTVRHTEVEIEPTGSVEDRRDVDNAGRGAGNTAANGEV